MRIEAPALAALAALASSVQAAAIESPDEELARAAYQASESAFEGTLSDEDLLRGCGTAKRACGAACEPIVRWLVDGHPIFGKPMRGKQPPLCAAATRDLGAHPTVAELEGWAMQQALNDDEAV